MADFLYLYRGTGPVTAALSPQQMQDYMQSFFAWVGSLSRDGRMTSCGPLEPGSRILRGTAPVTDGPYAEAKDMIGGYSLVSVKDLDEAVALARTCPFAEIGGTVEVRPVGGKG